MDDPLRNLLLGMGVDEETYDAVRATFLSFGLPLLIVAAPLIASAVGRVFKREHGCWWWSDQTIKPEEIIQKVFVPNGWKVLDKSVVPEKWWEKMPTDIQAGAVLKLMGIKAAEKGVQSLSREMFESPEWREAVVGETLGALLEKNGHLIKVGMHKGFGGQTAVLDLTEEGEIHQY
jgi:hypothetical protein